MFARTLFGRLFIMLAQLHLAVHAFALQLLLERADGWLRLMKFRLQGAKPQIGVSTYSTFYKANAAQLPTYSAFYKAKEKPQLTDQGFINEEEFVLPLDGFAERFASAKVRQ
jgi:hypothetical protein